MSVILPEQVKKIVPIPAQGIPFDDRWTARSSQAVRSRQ